MEPPVRCVIVTPTFNSARFLDETIASVVFQTAADVAIDYHVQDGGSSDATEAIVRAWIARIEGGQLPRLAGGVRLTWASAPDAGMYDAINTGMAALAPQPADVVTWINSDDRLAPGAVATVTRIFAEHSDCEFVSGRTALLNEAGSIVSITYPQAYTRALLAAGAHDGRGQAFIMQEGTFFTGRLWSAVGGVDPSFRLAGDWDLWRRMARETAHVSVDTVTAFHRRRAGQLSSDMASYHAEVDARAAPVGERDVAATPPRLVRYDADTGRWIATPFDALASRPPLAVIDGHRRPACEVVYLGGFGAPEGPYPEFRLPSGIRWLRDTAAELAVEAPYDGRFRLTLTVRPTAAALRLRLHANGVAVAQMELAAPVPDTDQLAAVTVWLGVGRNVIELELADQVAGARLLLLVGCTVVAEADARREAPDETPPLGGELLRAVMATAVVVTSDGNATRLAETIASVRDVAGPALMVVVEPGTDAAGVIDALVPYADRFAPGDAPGAARLRAAGYRSVLEITAGDRLCDGALAEAHRVLRENGAGAVVGFVDLVGDTGAVARRLLADESGPVLRQFTDGGATIRAPLRMATRHGELSASVDGRVPPRVWLLDHATSWHPARPLLALAGALRLLGVDARYAIGPAGSDGLVIAAAGTPDAAAADYRASVSGGDLRLEPVRGGDAITLARAIDADAFRPRARGPSRRALGLGAETFLVLAEPEQVAAVMQALPPNAQVATLADAPVKGVVTLPCFTDPDMVAHVVSAFDAVVTAVSSDLALLASACGVPALDPTGASVTSKEQGAGLAPALRRLARNHAARRLDSSDVRAAVERGATLAALALALREQAGSLHGLADWLGARDHLAAGSVALPTDVAFALEPPVPQHRGFALWPLAGASIERDPEWANVIRFDAPDIVLLLRVEALSGTALRLHLTGAAGSAWTVQVDDEAAVPLHLGAQPITTARIVAPLAPGLHRVAIQAIDPAAHEGSAATRIVAWEVLSTRASPPIDGTRTRLAPTPLAGRQVDVLESDGDWQPGSGFLPPEAPHPAAGLHAPFRWTEGDSASFRLRVEHGGVRTIDLAVTGTAAGQRMRLATGAHVTGWSAPLLAYVGRVSHAQWEIDWPAGDIGVTIELEDRATAGNPRDLGVLLLGITLS